MRNQGHGLQRSNQNGKQKKNEICCKERSGRLTALMLWVIVLGTELRVRGRGERNTVLIANIYIKALFYVLS